MMTRYRTSYVTTAWLLLACFVPIPTQAAESGCNQAAEAWIVTLDDAEHSDIFLRHTRNNCNFSGGWVRQSRDDQDPDRRARLCQDLVLIWTHKNCGYFRDVINPAAYEPCKAWSREMHQHCMDNDVDWFP